MVLNFQLSWNNLLQFIQYLQPQESNMQKRNKKKGQVTLEMALLILVMIGMTQILQNAPFIKGDNGIPSIFGKFLIKPWTQVRVMMESGVWNQTELANGRDFHPAQRKRLYSMEGDVP